MSQPEERILSVLADDPEPELEAVRREMFAQLEIAAERSSHGFHLPVIATVAPGPAAAARTVVLRDFDSGDGTMSCHTDRRSPKVSELLATPHACWVFYDRDSRVQLVAEGPTAVHTNDEIADAAWASSRAESLRCYLAPAAPGMEADSRSVNLPEDLVDRKPTSEEASDGRGNFAVLRTRVDRFDLLYLTRSGNLRAEWHRRGNDWQGNWVMP